MRKSHILFIGSHFQYNQSLKNYILREIHDNFAYVEQISFFANSDKFIFLHLEKLLEDATDLFIITSKNSFSVMGKLICTITEDNQIVKDNMLLPSQSTLYEKNSYLLEYKEAKINVINCNENYLLPTVLLTKECKNSTIHLFDETYENAILLLEPIAQSFDVKLHVSLKVEGWLQIDIASRKHGNSSQFIHSAKTLLPKNIITSANIGLHIIEKLQRAEKKLSLAESCTGGLLAYFFTRQSGASTIFDGSLISYSNTLKENWLNVSEETLERLGAVSNDVVSEMSEGALHASYADYTLAVSGIAGPTGATEDKSVGTVCIGVRTKEKHREEQVHFNGDRESVQEQSLFYAVKMLLLEDKELFFEI